MTSLAPEDGQTGTTRQPVDNDDTVPHNDPESCANLAEVADPEPVENPDELPVTQHHSIEECIDDQRRHTPSAGGSRRPAPAVSRLRTELYTIAYLVFFSIVGTMARVGLSALTTYTGAPVVFGILWSNFAGTAVLGFLAELAPVINRDHAAAEQSASGRASASEGDKEASAPPPPPVQRRPIPLYVGLATGYCGSFTSFSSFMMDAFHALANTLPAPQYHRSDTTHDKTAATFGSSASALAGRRAGFDVMALLAVLFLTVCMCMSALKLGAHLAIVLCRFARHHKPASSSCRLFRLLHVLDSLAVPLAFSAWLAAVLLAIFEPGPAAAEDWRGKILFALVFAPLGTLLRFYASLHLNGVFATFPLGTFSVNILGTAVLGMAWDLQHAPLSVTRGSAVGCQVLQGVMDGFCGCLTTVSTWMAELSGLRRRHAYVYGFASIAAGVSVMVLTMGSLKWTVGWQEPVC